MITPEETGQDRIFFESVQFEGEQGDATDKQYVFPRQCLVLGDSEVGKTSLVKSLTGKPFDPTQQKTQGIDQCLVDNEWKYCNLKDLVFGDLWKFFESGQVELLLNTSGTASFRQKVMNIFSKPWQFFFDFGYFTPIMLFFISGFVGTTFNFPMKILPICSIFFIHLGLMFFQTIATHFKSTSNLRFISATLVFMLSSRGFLIGSYLPLVMCYLDESYIAFASTRTFLTLGTGAGITFVAMFILIGPIQMPFCTGRLVENHNFIPILCFCRLLLSIFIGVVIGFVAAPSVLRSLDDQSGTETLNTSLPLSWHRIDTAITSYFVFVSAPMEIIKKHAISINMSIQHGLWGPFNILLIVAAFYHCKLAITTPIFYFVITYPLFICFTFCQEWFRVRSMPNITRCLSNNIRITLMATGKIDNAMLKGALNERFPSLKLQMLDFAGDEEYYAYHHVFLKSQAIYVIVFNVAKHIQNNFKNIDAAIERLQFWLESVSCHVPPKTPIFLVGTHRGALDDPCMQVVNYRLKEKLWNSYCDELVVNDDDELIFFPVENSKGENDVGVQSLRIKVMSVAEERDAARDCDIPLSWITIQDAIINRREMERAKFCVTLEEFPCVFNNFICTNWSKETLKYFHEKGLVIYLDKDPELSKWVLLKPEILVDIIIQLVTPRPQMIHERGFRRDWELLHDKGILTKSLLTRIISTVKENEEAMNTFLEEYDLICPLSYKVCICSLSDNEEHKPTHFVPSLLPKSTDGCIPAWHDNTTDKTFYVFFKRFLPEPLFHRLLSRAHKNSKVEFPNGPPVMFKDVGKFWMSPWQPYRLKLMKEEAIIEVTFSSSNMQGMKPADMLCQVFSMVDGICKRNFSFVKFHCGPACPSHDCPGYQDNYMYTPHQHNRRHVYNVMPGRQGDKVASLYCVNKHFEEELKEWIP